MENSILTKISSIIMSEPKKGENQISLIEYIDLMDYINNQISKATKEFMKSVNNKLSNNLAFFDYEIKNIKFTNKIIINVTREFVSKEIIISPRTLKVTSDLKNKEIFSELIKNDLNKLLEFLEQYSYLNDVSFKLKHEELNVVVDSKEIELYMHKSPNWITMGKAFSLKYLIEEKKFKYELDLINLEKSIKNQEKLLLSKIFFNISLLPSEMQILNSSYKKHKVPKKNTNLIMKIINKLLYVVKK